MEIELEWKLRRQFFCFYGGNLVVRVVRCGVVLAGRIWFAGAVARGGDGVI